MSSNPKQPEGGGQQPPKKKRRQQLWRDIIPTPAHYHVSFMHRDIVTHAVSSQKHGYVVTASSDGVVKFWKRITIDTGDADAAAKAPKDNSMSADKSKESITSQCLEFVKSFTAHVGPVVNLQVSYEGDTVISVGLDRVIKVYDVSTFDVTGMIKIEADGAIGPAVLLAQDCVALALGETIFVYVLDTLSLLKTITVHASPITAMVYNPKFQCVLSTDRRGILELWCAQHNDSLGSVSVDGTSYASKSDDTDLYTLFQKKTFGLALATSGSHYALYGANGLVYIVEHTTGKIVVRFDERLKVYDATYQEQFQMDALEYGKRAATEREMQQESPIFGSRTTSNNDELYQSLSITFDGTGNFLLVPTLVGIKVFDWARRKVVKIVGNEDANAIRMIGVCLCEGDAKVNQQMQLARSGGSKTAMNHDAIKLSDALIVSVSYQKRRFYVFSHKDPFLEQDEDDADAAAATIVNRDVLNEPPTAEDRLLADNGASHHATANSKLGTEAILRTTMGDVHMKLFAKEVPRTIENFCTHARNGYYNNVIFHRVISSFMLQTGDPLGDGTGGESIWGGEFEDEFVRELRHDRPFTVSMANAGPNTNGSQFFITVCPTPWLDQKHTVFGRITKGMDICTAIEKIDTDHNDKPVKEISILSIDIN